MSDKKSMVVLCGKDGTEIDRAILRQDENVLVTCPTCGQQNSLKEVMAEIARNHILAMLKKKVNPTWVMREP